jgi:epoxide hydrolase 4
MSISDTLSFQRIVTNGINLHVASTGSPQAPLVILLHGFPEFWWGWRKQIPALEEAGYALLIPDQRGYNLSDKPNPVAAYNIEILAQDILGLMDAFGRKKVFLVGHDWGATVAWTIALRHPERLHGLAILNVPHPHVMQQFLTSDLTQMRKSWYIFFFQLPKIPELMLQMNHYANLRRALQVSSGISSFDQADLRVYTEAWSQPGALTGMINWYRAIFRRSLRSLFTPGMGELPQVKVPTIILWGEQDIALRLEMAEASIKLCERGQLFLFPKASHWIQHDESDQVNAHLVRFFSNIDTS